MANTSKYTASSIVAMIISTCKPHCRSLEEGAWFYTNQKQKTFTDFCAEAVEHLKDCDPDMLEALTEGINWNAYLVHADGSLSELNAKAAGITFEYA